MTATIKSTLRPGSHCEVEFAPNADGGWLVKARAGKVNVSVTGVDKEKLKTGVSSAAALAVELDMEARGLEDVLERKVFS